MNSAFQPPKTTLIKSRYRLWESYGCVVEISNADITTASGCGQLLSEAAKLGQVDGVFNLAVVLRDEIFLNQTANSFRQCLAPKSVATAHLDALTRRLCPELSHFVVFSSVACGMGNAAQANYGMANSIMERIIEKRRDDKLPAKAIQWGAVGDVGLAYKLAKKKSVESVSGYAFQGMHRCLNVLDDLLESPEPIVASYIIAQKVEMKKVDLVSTVLGLLGISDVKSVSVHSAMSDLGMDSLVNTEMKQLLKREFDIEMTQEELRELTVKRLIEMSGKTDKKLDKEPKESPKPSSEETPTHSKEPKSLEKIAKVNSIPDTGAECILFVPGIEGTITAPTKRLCDAFKQPTYFFSYRVAPGSTKITEVVADSADVSPLISRKNQQTPNVFLVPKQEILRLYKDRKQFHIVGYSVGTMVAIEIARLLERNGMSGTLYLIDGSPKLFYANEDFVRNGMINQFNTICGFPAEVVSKISSAHSSEEKLMCMINHWEEIEGSETAINMVKAAIEAMKIYPEEYTLRKEHINCRTVVIKAKMSFPNGDDGIDEICNGKIERHELEGTHFTVIGNKRLEKLVQSYSQ